MKRPTKKEREQRKAEKAAVREQIAEWVAAKSEVSLVFVGPFYYVGMEGHLKEAPGKPDVLHFFGSQTSFRMGISLDRCASVKIPGRDDSAVALFHQEASRRPTLYLFDPKRPMPDVTKLLKLSGGRPN